MSGYAGVSLLDTPFHIDGVYDYRIPTELREDVCVGSFVTVPFGTANHRRLALVRELKDKTEYAEAKAIVAVCPEHLSLSEEMLGLCDFMKLRTLCTTGDAVRAMIPASALSRLVTLYTCTAADAEGVPPAALSLYEQVRESGEISSEKLRRRFGIGAEAHLRRLCRAGLLQKRVVLEDASEGKTERTYRVALSREEGYALIDGGTCNGVKLTSDKQKKILVALLESDVPMTAGELRDATGVSGSPLKTLLTKGVLCAEDIYLYPYKTTADIAFNTFHTFELGVMKSFVEKLIPKSIAAKDEYLDVVLRAVTLAEGIDYHKIPTSSLIREFVPGGIYESLY